MNNKITFTTIVFLFAAIFLSQTKSFSQYWIHGAGSTNEDEAMGVAKDQGGNIYTTGYFGGFCEFSDFYTFSSSGSSDIFLIKQNSSGQIQWVVKAGGWGEDRAVSIKTDGIGNSVITGFFYGTANFGTQTLTSSGGHDIFIAKYNTNGNLLWVVQAGGTGHDISNDITIDNNDNIIITGQFTQTATFGTSSISSLINPLNSQYCTNIFIAKYDQNGNFQWVKHGASDKDCRGISISTDNNGNIYSCGEFSDTLFFDVAHNNNIYNSIFVIKLNQSGNEQWFKKIGGSINNIGYSIINDLNNNVILTGEAHGILHFYDNSNYTLTNTYDYQAFLAKFSATGDLIWAVSDGSESEVSSKVVRINDSGDIFITGTFKCKFSEYADHYGQGTFNSIGYDDIFISKYDSNGQRLWMRNFGGNEEDFIHGMVLSNERPVLVGGFKNILNIPIQTIYVNGIYTTGTGNAANYTLSYCGDNSYGRFAQLSSFGNNDIYISDAINTNREPYDYYKRYGSVCDRPYIGCCIGDGTSGDMLCKDSIVACENSYLVACSNTASIYSANHSLGPSFNYLWSTGSTNRSISVNTSGIYSVTVTSKDGCFQSDDTIQATIYPLPEMPWISDNYGIGIDSPLPYLIEICGDSVVLTGSNITNPEYFWTWPEIHDSIITIYNSGVYYFYVVDTNGCESANSVEVAFFDSIPDIDPFLIANADSVNHDTLYVCLGNTFSVTVFDSISDPMQQQACDNPVLFGLHIWNSLPPLNTGISPCYTTQLFFVDTPGCYLIIDTLIRCNLCDSDTVVVEKLFYLDTLPTPEVNININGLNYICPGDTVLLSVCCASDYTWFSNSNFIGDLHNDSIWAISPGSFLVQSADTNEYGCSDMDSDYHIVQYWYTPHIQMIPSNGLICPNDSVKLTVNSGGVSYEWFGPNGQIPGNSINTYATSAGYYYCIVTFPDGCLLSSNTVEIKQYATPFLVVTPSETICAGDSAQICLVTNPGSNYFWDFPITGNDLCNIVYDSGIYTCHVNSCNIITDASTEILVYEPVANIQITGPTDFCQGDSVVLIANAGSLQYYWIPSGLNNDYLTVYSSGNYFVIVTDQMGCSAISDTISINVNTVTSPVAENDTICDGQFSILTANGGNNYNWLSCDTCTTVFCFDSIYTTPVLYDNTSYYIYSTNGSCQSLLTQVTVVVLDSLNSLTPNLFSNSPVCESDTLIIASDSPPNSTWYWSGPNGFTSSDSILYITGLSSQYSGNFYLYIENDGCLSYQNSIPVTIYASPEILLSNDTIICPENMIEMYAFGGVTYHWFPDIGINNTEISDPFITPDSSLLYFCIVSDTNGCIDTASVYIQVQQIPSYQMYSYDTTIIIGETISLNLDNTATNLSFHWSPENEISCNFCSNPTATPLIDTEYHAYYEDSVGCVFEMIIVNVFILNEFSLDVPMAFTPNGDGINDIAYVRGWGIKDLLEFRIYNRWGQEIFYSDDINKGWDGTFKGLLQNIETYAWYVKVRFYNDMESDKHGTINLLR